MDLDEHMRDSNASARRGRIVARTLFHVVLFLLGFLAFAAIASPSITSGRDPRSDILAYAGFLGVLVGVAWMWRIVRADPEPDASAWRYRDR